MRLFCSTLIEELQKNYGCYGFNYNISQSMHHQPIQVLGNLSPVVIHHINATYEVHLRFKQDVAVPRELAMQNVLMRGSSALGDILYGCIRNIRCQISMDTRGFDYEVDMILGDEERIKEMTKKIRDIEWNRYSVEFDAEIDETLKSE